MTGARARGARGTRGNDGCGGTRGHDRSCGPSPTADRHPSASCVTRARSERTRRSGWNERPRATSPRSAARRRRGQVGDSCLRHGTWRCDLFSFCYPRLRCVRPPEAAAVDSAAAIALAARIDTQGAHHARPHKAARRTQRHAAATVRPKRLANVSKLKRARRRFDAQRAVRGSRGVARRHCTRGKARLHRCTAIDFLTIGRHGAPQRICFSHRIAPRGPAHFDRPPQRTAHRHAANGCPSTQRKALRRAASAHRRATR